MQTTASPTRVVTAPSMRLFGTEPLRAALEYAGMRCLQKKCLSLDQPKGDGHPVVIFPGLAGDGRTTASLRTFCTKLGYTAYDWGRGFNTGPQGDINGWLEALADDVHAMVSPHGEHVTLIGWSLGGIYAREVAKYMGTKSTRQVITVATPFAGDMDQTNVGLLYRILNGQRIQADEALKARLRTAPEVPTTSIYSRGDGVVAWQACLQAGKASHTENIEVSGSHCGMCWNPAVLNIIADRLRQPLKGWKPFRPGAASPLSGTPPHRVHQGEMQC